MISTLAILTGLIDDYNEFLFDSGEGLFYIELDEVGMMFSLLIRQHGNESYIFNSLKIDLENAICELIEKMETLMKETEYQEYLKEQAKRYETDKEIDEYLENR